MYKLCGPATPARGHHWLPSHWSGLQMACAAQLGGDYVFDGGGW
jgi:hypothetical protein